MRKRLSRGEWLVMTALWRAGSGATVDDVRDWLKRDERDYRTIQTILRRCEEKGWVRTQRTSDRRVYYSAKITRRKGVQERAVELFAELTQGDDEAIEFARTALARELGLDLGDRDDRG